MISTQDIADWLNAQDATINAIVGPFVPDMPDGLCVLTLVSGPGILLEGTIDGIAVQARVRGQQRNPTDAETRAYRVDNLIIEASKPGAIGSHWFTDTYRLGGTPTPVQNDLDGERVNFTAAYVFEVGRL